MAMYNRDQLLKDLREFVIEVTFNKVNGDQRQLRCTLDPSYLPPNYNSEHLEEQHRKPENLGVIAAWDVQANGWRSFRIENVTYVQTVVSV
jgi:hypothetical protein